MCKRQTITHAKKRSRLASHERESNKGIVKGMFISKYDDFMRGYASNDSRA
jgi:hypothetical protein